MIVEVGLKVLNRFERKAMDQRHRRLKELHLDLRRAHRSKVKSIENEIKWVQYQLDQLITRHRYGKYKRLDCKSI